MAYGTIRADIIEGTNVTIDLSVAGQYDFAGDLLPDASGSRDLGTAALQWGTLYINAIDGFTAEGDIIPDVDSAHDLGSSALRWANLYVDAINAAGNVVPSADSTHDLGTNSVRWRNVYADDVYTGDLHLKNDKGDWTMIEESDFLTLRNNKTGRVFRLVMEEMEG